MSGSSSPIDPHGKMRARDASKVARGEQAPRPPHEYGSLIQAPPKPSPQGSKDDDKETQCYESYLQHHMCIQEKGKRASECKKLAKKCQSLCPSELIERWDKEREHGTFSGPVQGENLVY